MHILQEAHTFKKFGDSLLVKSAKLSDLVSAVESYLAEIEEGHADQKRVTKYGS